MAEKEYIERGAAINQFTTNSGVFVYGVKGVAAIISRLRATPTADVVEVVRCKDCKHWLKDAAGCTDLVGRCEWANYMVGANGYCVYGEAKMDGKGEG